MKELSLFTGAGGGLLGTKLLGWENIGYVEKDDYCQRIIAQRIKDGILDEAPIFGDIKTFISEGYAKSYKEMVDVITAGFPCQPFSIAGRQKGEDDERNLWPETIECIRIIRPRYAFLENVPNLLTYKYFGRILGDLAESGYDARWRVLSAAEVGAQHKRNRLWIVAYSGYGNGRKKNKSGNEFDCEWKSVKETTKVERPSERSEILAYTKCKGLYKGYKSKKRQINRSSKQQYQNWKIEPRMGRVAHGVACRVDRLKAIGNGQVPKVVETVWRLLTSGRGVI